MCQNNILLLNLFKTILEAWHSQFVPKSCTKSLLLSELCKRNHMPVHPTVHPCNYLWLGLYDILPVWILCSFCKLSNDVWYAYSYTLFKKFLSMKKSKIARTVPMINLMFPIFIFNREKGSNSACARILSGIHQTTFYFDEK